LWDPRRRLGRVILGESVLAPRLSHALTARRDPIPPPRLKVFEPKTTRAHKVRAYREIVEAGPNAPKLNRLIRRRYAEECVRPQRQPSWRLTFEDRTPPTLSGRVRAALDARQPPERWPRATRECSGIPKRPRIDADAWLEGAGK
jgi:hypothetical protein